MRVPGVSFVQGRNDYSDSDGRKYGLAIHNTSNTASAADEASYATRRTDGVSSHFYADSTQVIQSLDTSDRAGHAGSSEGNGNAIAVEITGLNSWTRQQWLDRVDWAELGRVLAVVCETYDIAVRRASVAEMRSNPKVRAIYSHDDMRRAWGGTTHTDPGPGFPWDKLLAVIAADGDEDDMDAGERYVQHVMNYRLEALRANRPTISVPAAEGNKAFTEPNQLALALTDLGKKVDALAATPPGSVTISDDQLERVLRKVIGSVDGAS